MTENSAQEKRDAQKRETWIANVKRIEGLSQEHAEALWEKIFNRNSDEILNALKTK